MAVMVQFDGTIFNNNNSGQFVLPHPSFTRNQHKNSPELLLLKFFHQPTPLQPFLSCPYDFFIVHQGMYLTKLDFLHFALPQHSQQSNLFQSINFTQQISQVALPFEVQAAIATCFNWALIAFYCISYFLNLLFAISSNP